MALRSTVRVLVLAWIAACGEGGANPADAPRQPDAVMTPDAAPDAAPCTGANCCANGLPLPDPAVVSERVFAQYIWPYVLGPSSTQASASNCASNACHGNDARAANPAALLLRDPDLYCSTVGASDPQCATPAAIQTANLVELMCWTDANRPLRSAIVTCPLGDAACPVDHAAVGGGVQWAATTDARYRAVANLALASRGGAGALEDIFYRRQLVPAFTTTQYDDGAGQLAGCSDSNCHVPGGSAAFDDPMTFAGASLLFDTFDPLQSAALVFPEDLSPLDPLAGGNIAHAGDATTPDGLDQIRYTDTPHDFGGGGPILDIQNNFDNDAAQLRTAALLGHFAPTLGPDPVTGEITDWLIADRPFALGAVTDPGPAGAGEPDLTPVHFEDPGAAGDPSNVNGGRWLDLFALAADGSSQGTVDVLAYFAAPVDGGPVATADGDTTYLFAYVYSTRATAQSARLAVTSGQPFVVYLNGSVVLTAAAGGDLDAAVTIAAGRNDLLIKTQRQAGTWRVRTRLLDAAGAESVNANVRTVVDRLRAIPGQTFIP